MAGINYLNTIDIGKVSRWQNVKASTLSPITFPLEDADRTEAVDTLGIIAYINIVGTIVGTFESLQNTIYLIRNILDGAQRSATQLRSPFVNGKLAAADIADPSTQIQGHIGTNTTATANKLIDSTANFTSWGITTADKVKDLISGSVYRIASKDSETEITLNAADIATYGDPFTSTAMPYAVTATMDVKILSFDCTWVLPGMNFVNYQLAVIQVNKGT